MEHVFLQSTASRGQTSTRSLLIARPHWSVCHVPFHFLRSFSESDYFHHSTLSTSPPLRLRLPPAFRLSVSSSACHRILSCSPHGTLCNSLYSVPLSLPLRRLYSPPLSVLIICHGTLILQGNSHWFPFLSCPALICYATAVPLTRLIGHCPPSFQLPSLLLPFSPNLVPLHHPPPVV